jgi:hypothetical protein
MIEHVDLQNPGSLGQPASQPDIGFARRRIPGRMVVLCEAQIYVRCPAEALVGVPVYEARLIHPLHVIQPRFEGYVVSHYVPYLSATLPRSKYIPMRHNRGCLFFR